MRIGYWFYHQQYEIAKNHYLATIVRLRVDPKWLQEEEKKWEKISIDELQHLAFHCADVKREYLIQRIAREILYKKDDDMKRALGISTRRDA